MATKQGRSRGGRRFVVNVSQAARRYSAARAEGRAGAIRHRQRRLRQGTLQWMLCDFYGKVLIPPTTVETQPSRTRWRAGQLKAAREQHDLRDLIIAVERTGRYHQIPQRLFAANGNEVRLVHPFTSKQHRTTTDPGNKTATSTSRHSSRRRQRCALMQAPVDPIYRELQLLIRQRRDWVRKTSMLCCQIREYLHSAYPGYAACFATPWHSDVMITLVGTSSRPPAMLQAGVSGLCAALREHKIRSSSPPSKPC